MKRKFGNANKVKLILLALGSLLVFSNTTCKKIFKKHTIVEGKVINYGSKQPIEGVMVVLQDGISGGNWMNSKTSSGAKSETTTDANGNFKIELYGDYDAGLWLSKEHYNFEVSIQGASQGIKGYSSGTHKNEILEMKAEAYFAPILKSKYQSYDDDKLVCEYFTWYKGKLSENGFGFTETGKSPLIPYPTSFYRTVGDIYTIFRLTLSRQGQTTVKVDSIKVPSLQFYRDTIYY